LTGRKAGKAASIEMGATKSVDVTPWREYILSILRIIGEKLSWTESGYY